MNSAIPICDYEGSRYATEFWNRDRRYEDLAERVALKKLLPPRGGRILDIGAGAGRLADLYAGYGEVVLMDYAHSVLVEARQRWGDDRRFRFVEADVYALPFAPAAFDTLVMVRVMHHLVEVDQALAQVVATLRPGATLVLEYASKRHLKAIARWLLRRQTWSPFDRQPYEFASLNFDFHPAWMTDRLHAAGLSIRRELTVSHFRAPLFKRLFPPAWLATMDGWAQNTARWWKLSPSVFVQAQAQPAMPPPTSFLGAGNSRPSSCFKCPACGSGVLISSQQALDCPACGRRYPIVDGVYVFKETDPSVPTHSGAGMQEAVLDSDR